MFEEAGLVFDVYVDNLILQEVIMASEDESIEQKAAARKEALKALRAAQELSETKEDGEDEAVEEE